MINKAFQAVKEKNGNTIIGVKASLVPDSFQTQVVAGTKFMFTLQTNAGEHIKFTVFRSLPSWGGADNNSGTVTYTVSKAVHRLLCSTEVVGFAPLNHARSIVAIYRIA